MIKTSSTHCVTAFIVLATTGLLAAWLAPAASAQELGQEQELFYPTDTSGSPAAHWGVGLGVGSSRKPYAGADTEAHVLPLLMFENRWVSVTGLGVGVKLPSAGPFQFRLNARYAGGYTEDDAPILNGMQERKGSIWVGPQATWRSGAGNLSAEWLGDATGHSKGQQFKLAFDHDFRSGAFSIRPRVGVKWLDDKYVDYYYGVTQAEAAGGRPAYTGKASTDPEIGVRVSYSLAPGHILSIDASANRLGGGITDSPLVDRTNQFSVRLGYLYRY